MRILLVEDDEHLRDFLSSHIPQHGFITDAVLDGSSGLLALENDSYDLVILDLNLPDISGEAFITRLRQKKNTLPVLMLTVVPDTDTKVRLLQSGVDDYLVKPFALEELIARIRALLRRVEATTSSVLSVDDLVLDSLRQTVHRGEQEIHLTKKEFALLEYLMRRSGAMVSKNELIEEVWETVQNPFSNAIDTHIANIRRKLGKPGIIHTIHGRGYKVE